jgi:hypothetical protein
MRVVALLIVVSIVCTRAARAQDIPPRYLEYRADAIVSHATAVEGGLGAVVSLGTYMRMSADGAVGGTWDDGAAKTSGRVDVIGRFLLDPYREQRVGMSVGGGVSVPYVSGAKRVRPYLTAVIDVEGRRRRSGVTPALEIGLGGGARIGVVLRMSPTRWR